MGNARQVNVYHWKYDDGSRGYAVRLIHDKKKKWLKHGHCIGKADFKRIPQDLNSKYTPLMVTKKKCWVPGGLSDMQPGNFSAKNVYDSQDGVEAMNDLIHSAGIIFEGPQTMLKLVSAILAGYCAQSCSKYFKTDYVPPKGQARSHYIRELFGSRIPCTGTDRISFGR